MGFLEKMKEKAFSGQIYALYSAQESRYPDESIENLLAETCRKRFEQLKKKYDDMPDVSLSEVKNMLEESGVTDIDLLVEFLLAFERKAEELH